MSLKTKEHFMQRIWKIQRKCDFFLVKITFWSCAFTKSFFEIWETKMTNPVKYLSHWRFQAHKLIRELRVPYLEHLAFVSLFVYLDQQVYSLPLLPGTDMIETHYCRLVSESEQHLKIAILVFLFKYSLEWIKARG